MKQLIVLDYQDIANLKHGQPLIIQLGNGQAIEIGYEGRVQRPTVKAPPKPAAKEKWFQCPRCPNSRFTSKHGLQGHVNRKHGLNGGKKKEV